MTTAASDLRILRLRNRAEYHAAMAAAGDALAFEQLLQQAYAQADSWLLPAVCHACGQAVALLADWEHSWNGQVNFRERLACPRCGLNTRQRFVAHLVREEMTQRPHRATVYLHEQTTAFFSWAQANLPAEVIGSEYLGPEVPGGAVVGGIRHEDALALSFPDASVDVVVSQDVLEHVPSIAAAVNEAARVLRPGGRFLFSVPFDPGADVTVQRAEIVDGEVVRLLDPVFHGNPISAEGSLVFYDHGWDLLDRLRAGGFEDVCLLGTWSALYGYLSGGLLTIFSAVRSA